MTIFHLLEKQREEFEKRYPINYGNPFPHFIETPVATHILQHISTIQQEILQNVREKIEGMKKGNADPRAAISPQNLNDEYDSALSDLSSWLEGEKK